MVCVRRRGVKVNTGLPDRCGLTRVFKINEDAVERTMGDLIAGKVLRIGENSNAFIGSARVIISSPLNLTRFRSGCHLTVRLFRIEVLLRPSMTTITYRGTARRSGGHVGDLYSRIRRLCLSKRGRVGGSVRFRRAVTEYDKGEIIRMLVPIVLATVAAFTGLAREGLVGRAVSARETVASTVLDKSAVNTGYTVVVRLACGERAVVSVSRRGGAYRAD